MTALAKEDYARKIDGLLQKAESTDSPAEAETFLEGAQRLMKRYSIDRAMIDAVRDGSKAEEIVRTEVAYNGSFRKPKYRIGAAIAMANDCRVLQRRGPGRLMTLVIIGFEGDVERAKMLDASVQIQGQTAMQQWAHEQRDFLRAISSSERWREKRQFLTSFAMGLDVQLKRAAAAATREVESEHEGGSVALVLRDKKQRVDDWMDKEYGELRECVSREYAGSSSSAAAGRAAGHRADAGCTAGRMPGAPTKVIGR
jgi:hypothetical protein